MTNKQTPVPASCFIVVDFQAFDDDDGISIVSALSFEFSNSPVPGLKKHIVGDQDSRWEPPICQLELPALKRPHRRCDDDVDSLLITEEASLSSIATPNTDDDHYPSAASSFHSTSCCDGGLRMPKRQKSIENVPRSINLPQEKLAELANKARRRERRRRLKQNSQPAIPRINRSRISPMNQRTLIGTSKRPSIVSIGSNHSGCSSLSSSSSSKIEWNYNHDNDWLEANDLANQIVATIGATKPPPLLLKSHNSEFDSDSHYDSPHTPSRNLSFNKIR